MADMTQFAQMIQNPVAQRAFQDAQQIAGMYKTHRSQQKQERLQPVTTALSGLGEQYKSAQTDEQRQQANALANLVRSNFVAGGGTPSDLGTQYYGSDPSKGFQTSQGFEAPVTGFEGLKRTDAITARRQALSDLIERQKWNMSPESQDWYLPIAKQTAEANLANTLRSANAPYGGGGGLTAYQQYQIDASEKAERQAYKAEIGESLTDGKLTRDQVVDTILKQYHAGIIPFDYANELLRTVDVFSPAPAPNAKPPGYDEDYVNRWLNWTPGP